MTERNETTMRGLTNLLSDANKSNVAPLNETLAELAIRIEKHETEIARLNKLLDELEWANYNGKLICPFCLALKVNGHYNDCARVK